MEIKDINIRGYERVVHGVDEQSGLDCIISVQNTKLGPALGGCRAWSYESTADHLQDALRLGKAMTMKNSLAGLDAGGGKGVINLKGKKKTPEIFQMYGEVVNHLGGTYLTGEDVGVKPEDVDEMKKTTKYVSSCGIDSHLLDPGPATAYGVIQGMDTAARFRLKPGFANDKADKPAHPNNVLTGLKINIQGLGNVGYALMEMLLYKGALVTVTDINSTLVRKAKSQHPEINTVDPDDIFDTKCDIFAPCALGGILNPDTIPRLRKSTHIVCGSANNQLLDEDCDKLLHDHRVLYCPDYLVNAGGVILIYKEESKVTTDFHVSNFIDMISDRLEECLNTAAYKTKAGIPTGRVAEQMALRRL